MSVELTETGFPISIEPDYTGDGRIDSPAAIHNHKTPGNSYFQQHLHKVQLCRDASQGEAAIKSKGKTYLPMPAAMEKVQTAPSLSDYLSTNPDYDANAPYSAYKARSRFPELVDATLRGIIGLILRNPSAYHGEITEKMREFATKDGKSLRETELFATTEIMVTGGITILVDPDENGDPKLVFYATEDRLAWRTKYGKEDNMYTSLLLRDMTPQIDLWGDDDEVERHLLLMINNQGVYEVGKYEDGKLQETVIPTVKGKVLDFIPAITAGSMDLTADLDTPPMFPLANVSKSIYQVTADLRNAQYMSCNPMLTISGVDPEQVPTAIGSNVALILEQYTSKAYYPSTDTSALEHVRQYIKDLESEAIRMGANLLGNDKTQAESGEAIRLRQSMASATVATVVSTAGKAVEKACNYAAFWDSMPVDAEIKVNTEFSSFQMTANEQVALVQSWQAGLLSTETTLENFRRAGMLQDGEDAISELERIDKDVHRFVDEDTNDVSNDAVKKATSEVSLTDVPDKTGS